MFKKSAGSVVASAFQRWSRAASGALLLAALAIAGCHNGSDAFVVTAVADHGTVSPGGAVSVHPGSTQAFTVTFAAGYSLAQVTGDCPAGTWAGAVYTTGAIVADCSLTFVGVLNTFSVTASGDDHETVTPGGAQAVSYGATQAFMVAADTGYTVSTAVAGTCPAGSWAAGVYTTGAITAACSVVFAAAVQTFTVTASGDSWETLSPSAPQTVSYGGSAVVTVAANAHYLLSSDVGGSCAAGAWAGDVYTTGPIVADCTLTFSASQVTSTVIASGDGHETISPSGPQTVTFGSTHAYTVDAAEGYVLTSAVGGSCPAGSWLADVYTTGPITTSCTLTFSAAQVYQVTPSGDDWETISPNSAQMVDAGAAASFTVAADEGYTLSSDVGGDCPPGSWSGDVYTTGPFAPYYLISADLDCDPDGPPMSQSAPETTLAACFALCQATDGCNYFNWYPDIPYCNLNTTCGPTYGTPTDPSGQLYAMTPAACTVEFSAVLQTFQVTSTGDGWEAISPSTAQTVNYGATQSFTVTPSTHYNLASAVGGNCPAGSWSGSTYTTGSIIADCSVSFSATLQTFTVTAAGDGDEGISPSTPQAVPYNGTQAYTVTANNGYLLASAVSGSCPNGTWTGSTYTTGSITSSCSVGFSATPICDPSCLTCSAPGANECTSCPAGGTAGVAFPTNVYQVQGQSFTPSAAGNGNGDLQADGNGNVRLQSFRIAFVDSSTGATPANLYVYSALPTTADSATGAGSIGTGVNDGSQTGTYVFNPPITIPYAAKSYALLPASYNIYDDASDYTGGYDVYPWEGAPAEGFYDIGFTATFVGTTLTAADGGEVCELTPLSRSINPVNRH